MQAAACTPLKGTKPRLLRVLEVCREHGQPGVKYQHCVEAACRTFYRLQVVSVSDTGDWNPVKAENVVPVGIAAAFGSNATTQQEPVPPPLPFKGSPKVADGAVYEVKMLMSKAESGQGTPWCPRNFGPPIPPGKLLASML